MNGREDFDRAAVTPPAEPGDDGTKFEGIIPRVLRNMVLVRVLLVGPAFWFYRWAGAIGFALGTVVSYVNFKSLTRGVEGLSDRIVNRNSREKGGWIVLRFGGRYGLVGAPAYVILNSSPLQLRGFRLTLV